ncbi:glycosyltransferase family 2 protein [Sphingomonas soli]|uniref:glycosyltransferase family 2 protein n=1 Tax=Sphingomonas soli TaxID=266127 RepID=UPI00083550FF|nr:glycosyltransferase family 2 protein [Sphingomonas soli]
MRKAAPTKAPEIALVMIVRDEARCIARCLESVRPHVDRMVVLDTGSTDGTPMLAASMGAQVHHMEWPDDFSAARNHALDIADSDWNLVLDADEWIISGGVELRRWCKGRPRMGKLCVQSAVEAEQGPKGASRRNWMTRLLPRGVRYEGRIHEQAVSPLPRERIELQVGHDGYLEDQLARKRGRNGPLLLAELSARPGDPYLLYQLGKDSEMNADLQAASDYYAQSLTGTASGENWRHGLVIRQMRCLSKTGRLEAALELADAELPNWGKSPDFYFVLGNLLLDKAMIDPARAVQDWLPLAAGAWEHCLAIGERPDLEGSMPGCGSHLAEHNLAAVRTQMTLHAARHELAQLSN